MVFAEPAYGAAQILTMGQLVTVRDQGPGIAPEDRERIFESFYTANHGLADSHRSVGLGLSLCRSIALAHGGSIEVAAADPHGSVFTIELPVADVSFDKE